MKPSFHARLLNGPFGDPGLYIRILREGRALLFDLGSAANLSAGDMLKTSDIFVSHTHVDHFIGFDNILRTCLKRDRPLRLYGPEGFTDCVEGRLKGYTWNLTEDYPLVIEVSEVTDQVIKKSKFKAANAFRRGEPEAGPFEGVLLKDPLFKVSAAIIDHQIPCLAFSLEEEYHINIDKAKLERLKLPVGPWLAELKTAIRENRADMTIEAGGRGHRFEDLRDIADITKGQKLSYVVDALGSDENVRRLIDLVKGSDVLYIETYFADEDSDRARERYHLTAVEAGRIAREARAGRLEAIHFSPRYINEPERLPREAEEEFKR